MNPRQVMIQGLWQDNPALVQLLGLCPLLAVSNSVVNALGLGLATLAVLTLSNLSISSLRHLLDDSTRLPAQIMVIATFVTCADLILQAFFFDVHHRIGLFVALIVTNCTLLGRAESFARRNSVSLAVLDGAMMGLGFLFVILIMGAIRELLGNGTLFANMDMLLGPFAADWQLVVSDTGFLLTLLPPGAFLTLGCLIALKNFIEGRLSRRSSLIPVVQK